MKSPRPRPRRRRVEPKLELSPTVIQDAIAEPQSKSIEAPVEEPRFEAPTKQYWRSLEWKARADEAAAKTDEGLDEESARLLHDEFATPTEAELEVPPHSRRSFMGLLGSGMALAGVGAMSGCLPRRPKQHILPYNNRPEDLIPGKPRFFATSMLAGDEVLGLVVESQDGRPTKVEGNFRHKMNKGRVSHWAQASVLGLWDIDRAHVATKAAPAAAKGAKGAHGGGHGATKHADDNPFRERVGKGREKVSADEVHKKLAAINKAAQQGAGEGLALLVQDTPSPTLRALVAKVKQSFPKARIYRHEPVGKNNIYAGLSLVGVTQRVPLYQLQRAKVVLGIDADFLGTEGNAVRNQRLFAERRRVRHENDSMNRLYVVEPVMSVTGANADHRLTLPASKCGEFLAELAGALFRQGVNAPAGAEALANALKSRRGLAGATRKKKPTIPKWIAEVAKDLRSNHKQSVIIVGERQPPRVHALAHMLNLMLGNIGRTVELMPETDRPAAGGLAALVKDAASIKTLVILGGNPVFTAPADLGVKAAIGKIADTLHLSDHIDETSVACKLHVPLSHYLETWGDLRATDGTVSIQQPLIAPLFKSMSAIELLARLLGETDPSPHAQVKSHFTSAVAPGPQSSVVWRYALHDGRLMRRIKADVPKFDWSKLAAAWSQKPGGWPSASRLEIDYTVDWSTYDGRYGHNGWLIEVPDPLTKLSWDNAAIVGPTTAKALKLSSGDMCELAVGGRKLSIPVWVAPGVATGTVALQLGWGRKTAPRLAVGAGFNAYALRSSKAPWIASEASLKRTRGKYKLVTTQEYGSLAPSLEHTAGIPKKFVYGPRPLVREATKKQYKAKPNFVESYEIVPKNKLVNLWKSPVDYSKGQQWGMSIDLNTCTGCNACLVACIAENNIPLAGKDRVANGREMHWIRLDRYYSGDVEEPEVVMQPLPCQQCERAPCEQVCPVAATMHTPDGLNDMVYNRCIGTRYCSNNCPYKVRRYNYFNFQKETDERNPMVAMQRNPDVSVRFRGVMEKCTYCTQRIQEGKHAVRLLQKTEVPDGAITPACAQTCPTNSIVFGDINDPRSRVSKLKRQNRDYTLLRELNNVPRTTYLAKIRNPNPRLV